MKKILALLCLTALSSSLYPMNEKKKLYDDLFHQQASIETRLTYLSCLVHEFRPNTDTQKFTEMNEAVDALFAIQTEIKFMMEQRLRPCLCPKKQSE